MAKQTATIDVYKSSEVFNTDRRWFEIPQKTLSDLFIVTADYDYDDDRHGLTETLIHAHVWAYRTYGKDIVIVSLLSAEHAAEALERV